jgi:hypothetical protein
MRRSSRVAVVALLIAIVAVTGCRSGSKCRDGSCGVPRYAPPAPGPTYAPAGPTYAPADGSGNRAPVMLPPAGSGTRGEGSGSR